MLEASPRDEAVGCWAEMSSKAEMKCKYFLGTLWVENTFPPTNSEFGIQICSTRFFPFDIYLSFSLESALRESGKSNFYQHFPNMQEEFGLLLFVFAQ